MTRFYLGRKDQSVKINMTTEQKEAVVEGAKGLGLSISDFTMMLYDQYFSQDGTQDNTGSNISPSGMPLEPMEVEEVTDSKEDEKNSLNGEVGVIQPDRVYNYQESGSRMLGEEELYYLETDLEFYQEFMDSHNETNLYRAMKSYRSSLVEILSKAEYKEAEEEIDILLAHYGLEHLKP